MSPPRLRGWRLALGRATVIALVGMVLLQVSELLLRMGPFSGLPESYTPWFPTLYASALAAAVIATGVSALLAVRGVGRPASLALAAASTIFTLCSLAVLGLLAPWDAAEHALGTIVTRSSTLFPAVAALGVAAFLRFTVLFPRPLTPAEVATIGRGRPDDSLGRSRRRLTRLARSAFERGRAAPAPPGSSNRPAHWWGVRQRLAGLLPARIRRLINRPVVVDAGRLLTEPRRLWTAAVVIAALPYAPLSFSISALALIGWMVAISTGIVLGIAVLRLGYGLAGEADRRRMRWIVEGMNATVWTFIALGPLIVLDMLGVRNPVLQVVPAVVFGILPLITAIAFSIAVFYDGALEPSLVIRKGALIGVVGFGLAFTFAIVEELVTEHLTTRLGLPDGAGTLVASGAVATIIGAFYARFRAMIAGYITSGQGEERESS